MSIVITGDTHGTFDIEKVVRYFNEHEDEYTRDDYLIICGDVGICGFSAAYEANTRAVFRSLPVTTLFIDGNHENFEQLNSYAVEQWNGGKVHIIEDNMIHLMRAQIFTIDGLKFFTFGGEYEEGWANLEKEDFQVDYILTHTAPRDVAAAMGYGELSDDEVELRQYLQRVADETEFQKWYFGHFHEDAEVEEVFVCLYDEVVEVS